jgi:DNA topoisomerase-2
VTSLVQTVTEPMWVHEDETGMVKREVTYVPGLYKIFDEILVNAADNKQRDPKMDTIRIDINPGENTISVMNNGKGIPCEMHKEEKMYVPTMIFGHLLTGSNFNDDEARVTGGRNGFGAKLCNVFSTKFTVETADSNMKKVFRQTWGDNMSKASDPKLKDYSGEDFTRVTFSPDLAKFGMERLDPDTVALLSRRAFDIAATTKGVKVLLNGKRVPVKSFKDYVDHYTKGTNDDLGKPLKVVVDQCGLRWEVAICVSSQGFQQISFVNSIATTKGGKHVDHVSDLVVKCLQDGIGKKDKTGMKISPKQIKDHMWVFIVALIENPTFDSQSKETMTLVAKSFGSKCELSDKFKKEVSKAGIVESVLLWSKFRADNKLGQATQGKKTSKLTGIPKLDDANEAGTKNGYGCTLILTEGDSAKTLAVSGISVVGKDYYGVYPLKGKLLNVREANVKQITENKEISDLVKIVGLKYKKKYESMADLKDLRYGKVMIMTDQDQDGSHIKGLVINFIHHNWPSLLKLPFLEQFITPIVKVTKGKGNQAESFSFYSLPEFQEWKVETENFARWTVKYYKGKFSRALACLLLTRDTTG